MNENFEGAQNRPLFPVLPQLLRELPAQFIL